MKTLEDLQYNGLKIYVDKSGFTYGRDAVLLANFAKPSAKEHILDLGTGTGILAILISGKTGARVTAVELQKDAASLAEESVLINAQQDKITVLNHDIRTLHTLLPQGSFDGAVCNPPYYKGGTKSENDAIRLSVHQDECSIYDAAACASRMIKNGGKFYLCYPADAVAECFHALVSNKLEPKKIQLVMGKGAKPYLALIEAKKGGKTGLVWMDTILSQE